MLRLRWRSRGEDGAVGANLAIVLGFALYAVVQLTRTTIAAQQIDTRVDRIVHHVGPIDSALDGVAQLDETNRIAAGILEAAKPLSANADDIIATAESIDGTVTDINANATSINKTVKAINGNANSIKSSVQGIGGSFTDLVPVVREIKVGVVDINGRADRIIALATAIRGDTQNILAEVGPPATGTTGNKTITGHANSIDCSAAATRPSACAR